MKAIYKMFVLLMSVIISQTSFGRTFNYTDNNSIELLKDSEKAAEVKLDMIRNAKHHIHIVSYYLDNSKFPTEVFNELKKAHERGVEVRILTTLVPTVVKDPTLKTKTNLSLNDGGAVFSYLLLKPVQNVLFLNNLHEKIFLVDGEKAVIGGRNLSDNSFRAKDIEALIEGNLVDQLQTHFKHLFDVLSDVEIKRCKKKDLTCKPNLLKQRFANTEEYFPPKLKQVGNIKARLLTHDAVISQMEKPLNFKERMQLNDDIIDAVTDVKFKTMRAYNYFILPTLKYQNFLFNSAKEGKTIKIMTNSLKTASVISNKGYLYSLPMIQNFIDNKIEVFQWQGPTNFEYLHEKVIVFDEDHVFLGSHNFGTGSTSVSNEISIEFYSKEIAQDLVSIFDEEIQDPNRAVLSTKDQISTEIKSNLKMVEFLRRSFVGSILSESY